MREYRVLTRAEELGPVANEVHGAGVIGLDIETYKLPGGSALDPRLGEIRLVQLNIDDKNIYVIDLAQTKTLGPIIDAMRTTKAVFVAHNAKFEQKWFWYKFRLPLWPVFCTYRASALIHNGREDLKHDLWALYNRELNIKQETEDRGASTDWGGTLTQADYDYAAEDVFYLPKLRTLLKEKLLRDGLNKTALIEFGVLLAEGEVELNGFPVDRARWLELSQTNLKAARKLEEELLRDMPHPTGQLALPGLAASWNVDSRDQLMKSLSRMKINVPDTQKLTLGMIAGKYPIVKKIMEYRGYSKKYSSFGPDWLRWVEEDGRIHCDYYALLAAGRYSASKPNLQQIPREAEFRSCFRAPDGKIFILADYSGIEMRIVAEISGDKRLTQVFVNDEDSHYATASLIMGKPKDQIVKHERQMAKPVNFGFIYGMMPAKLVLYALGNYGVPMTEEQAEKFRNKFFDREVGYYGIKRWHEDVLRDGQRSGISRTMSGRLRYLDRSAHNEFYNTPVQGTGADALKLALRGVHQRLEKYDGRVKMVHHVHDEIILEADDDPELVAAAKVDLCDAMTEAMQNFLKKVPVVVEPSTGYSWGEAKA